MFIPEDVERMVKKLEKKPEVEEPWALAQWMKKKGYKMPAEEYDPTAGGKKILAPIKAEENSPYSAPKVPKPKEVKTMDKPLGLPKLDIKRKSVDPTELRAEEVPLPQTPKETMKDYKPKGTKPTFIDTKPSGMGKPLEQYAEEDNKPAKLHFPKTGKGLTPAGRELFDMPLPKEKKKAEEEKNKPREVPGKAAPKTRQYLKERKLLAEEQNFDPKEMEMGMKEEMEHVDVTGGDQDLTRKIVEAHLKEDPQYYTKLNSLFHAEDNFKPFTASTLIEYHNFMSWMNEKSYKAKDEKELEEKMNEFEVDKFSKEAEIQPKPQFTAPEEAGITDTLKKLDPKPTMPKTDSVPNLTKHIVRQVSEEAGVMDKVKNVIKKLDPAPEKVTDVEVPPLTKTTQKNVVRKINSGV